MRIRLLNISGSVFVEKEVSPAIRASAQGIILMMTNGFGCLLGGIMSGKVVEMYTRKRHYRLADRMVDFHWLLRRSGLRVSGDVQI
ncbi:hypothetical protein ACNKHW_18570 [Shigella flexneri]